MIERSNEYLQDYHEMIIAYVATLTVKNLEQRTMHNDYVIIMCCSLFTVRHSHTITNQV